MMEYMSWLPCYHKEPALPMSTHSVAAFGAHYCIKVPIFDIRFTPNNLATISTTSTAYVEIQFQKMAGTGVIDIIKIM